VWLIVRVVAVRAVKVTESVSPTPMEVLNVAPLSATGSVVPSPTMNSPSARTAIAVKGPVPEPRSTPPSVNVPAPLPPLATLSAVERVNAPETSSAVEGFVVPIPTFPPASIVNPVAFVAEKAVSVIRKTSS